MAEQGYGHDSIKQQIAVIADLSRWLKQKDIQVHDLDDMMVDRFLQLRRSNIGSGEAIRRRWRDCWPCFARQAL
jgi:hypothetical protein